MTISVRPIGIIRSRFSEVTGMPIQTAGAPDEPRFDVRGTDRVGWFAVKLDQLSKVRSDDRMA